MFHQIAITHHLDFMESDLRRPWYVELVSFFEKNFELQVARSFII